MHLFLTDRITCPRCGPDFGLILLAHDVRDRRVIRGDLGCSNCRETYPVTDGFGDLRAPPRSSLDRVPSPLPGPVTAAHLHDPETPLRLAALMGVTEGPGTLLFTGPVSAQAGAVARLIGGVEAVALDVSGVGREREEGVSAMVSWPGIPFFSDTFRGMVLSGDVEEQWVGEAARVLAPGCRIAMLDAPDAAAEWLDSGRFQVVMQEDGILVAQKPAGQTVPLVPLRRA